MDKARYMSRRPSKKRSHNFAELAARDVSASEKTRKERFQRLSLVGKANSTFLDEWKSMGKSDMSDGEEERRKVVGRKRFKLPRKFLEVRNSVKQASIPRKLRSAMKKRSQESLSPLAFDSKKPKYNMRGWESLKNDCAKKTEKQGRSESSFSGLITQDEEEVVETLYSLAEMFLNNNGTHNNIKAVEESSRADTSAVPGGTETSTNSACEDTKDELKLSAPSYSEQKLSEKTMGIRCSDGPINCQQLELLESKLFSKAADRRAATDMQTTPSHSRSEKSNHELHASCNLVLASESSLNAHVNQPEKMDILLPPKKHERKEVVLAVNGNQFDLNHKVEDCQNNGPVLWPGLISASVSPDCSRLLQVSTIKIPALLHGACSTEPRPTESGFPIEKVLKSRVYKISQKKCMKHVFISHLIQTLQMPESKDKFPLRHNPGRQHEETKQRVNTRGPNFNVFENSSSQAFASTIVYDAQRVSSEARNAIPQQNRHSQGPKSSSPGNEGFNFMSLSTSVSGLHQKLNAPYLDWIAQQQHMSMPLSTSEIYNSHSRPDQLSGVTASRQVPLQLHSYLGNFGRSFLQQGSMVISKEQQHQQMFWTGPITSTQFKSPGNLKAVAQFPTWQNGRMESPAMVPFTAVIPPPPASSTELLGPKHSQLLSQQHLHHQQQQQLISLRSSFPPTMGKIQDSLRHSAHEEAVPRFHGSGSLSLQLLCNERL